jgi:hypothetical protein
VVAASVNSADMVTKLYNACALELEESSPSGLACAEESYAETPTCQKAFTSSKPSPPSAIFVSSAEYLALLAPAVIADDSDGGDGGADHATDTERL